MLLLLLLLLLGFLSDGLPKNTNGSPSSHTMWHVRTKRPVDMSLIRFAQANNPICTNPPPDSLCKIDPSWSTKDRSFLDCVRSHNSTLIIAELLAGQKKLFSKDTVCCIRVPKQVAASDLSVLERFHICTSVFCTG